MNMTSAGGQGSNFLPNNSRIVQSGGTRILCVADVRGISHLLLVLEQALRA